MSNIEWTETELILLGIVATLWLLGFGLTKVFCQESFPDATSGGRNFVAVFWPFVMLYCFIGKIY